MSEDEQTSDLVRRKAARIERARKSKPAWRQLVHVSVLGWLFALPLLALTYAGHWVAQRIGQLWPAGLGVVLGVALGGYLVWRQLSRELRDEAEN